MNPFRRSKRSFEQTVAETARDIATVAEGVASALNDDSQRDRRAPKRVVGAATFLGLTYVAAKRLGVAAAVMKAVADVRSGAAEAAGGAGDAVQSATPPASVPGSGGAG